MHHLLINRVYLVHVSNDEIVMPCVRVRDHIFNVNFGKLPIFQYFGTFHCFRKHGVKHKSIPVLICGLKLDLCEDILIYFTILYARNAPV